MASHTQFAAFRDWVLNAGQESPAMTVPHRVAVLGMGGVGKTALALTLAHDEAVRGCFSAGVLWVVAVGNEPAGPEATALAVQSAMSAYFGGPRAVSSVQQGREHLRTLLADRGCLVVLDGVVADADTLGLDIAGPRCHMLVIPQDPGVAGAGHVVSEPWDQMLRFSDFAFEEGRGGEARFAPVKVVITSRALEQESGCPQGDLPDDQDSGVRESPAFRQDDFLEIGGTVYPLRQEISGIFESINTDIIEFKVQGCGASFIGRGSTNGAAFQDWCDQVHSAFQALYRKQPFELSEEEKPKWAVLNGLIDVAAYQSRMPVVLNETGWISGTNVGMREVTWWPSERRETIAFEKMPVEFAGFGLHQWFEAIVERNRRTWDLRKGRHVQPTEPIAPMDDDEAAEQLAGAIPISVLPEATDGTVEP